LENEVVAGSTFGRLLRRHRLAAGLSQEVLAEQARISSNGIGALERGDRRYPQRETVALLLKALRLSPEAAAEFEGAATRPQLPRNRLGPVAAFADGRGPATNIPASRTALLARETDIAEIAQMLVESRLVTLTGAGGIGKTRIALAVGEGQLEAAPAGVWLVELAPLANQAYIASAIAQALDVRESVQSSLLDSLRAHVRDKQMLLILDNCEHVIVEAATVADALLRGCTQLRILATSREPLRIAGELIYRVPPLAVPNARETVRLRAADAADYPAVALFMQRAHATNRHFVLNDENAPTIAEICRRLDGIPLAIELAAARVNVLTVRALSTKLNDRFAILTGGSRSGLPRHRTMRALIDWSFDLLTPDEQRLFERLSVFAGGCDLAAAAAVLDDGADELEVLATLSSVVDKSLVIADTADCQARYRLQESTRQYACEKLAARGEATLVAHRHAQMCVKAAEDLLRSYGKMSDAQLRRTEVELDNWRAALEWALRGQGDIILGQRLAAAAWPIWIEVSLVEASRWISAAAKSVDDRTPPAVRARLDFAAARIAAGLGEWDAALRLAPRAIAAFETLGDTLGAAYGQCTLGMALLCVGRGAEAEPPLNIALTNARLHEDARLTGWVLHQLIYARSVDGDLARGRAYAGEALDIGNAIGVDQTAPITSTLGEAEFQAGNIERALKFAQQSVAAARRHPRARKLVPCLLNFAAYAIACERWDDALAASNEALRSAQETDRHIWSAWALQHIVAAAVLRQGAAADPAPARDAALVIGFVDARIVALGTPREYTEEQEYARVRIALDEALGPNQFERFAAAGAALCAEAAKALALSLHCDDEHSPPCGLA
jgi:predicted ATPase/DNA-binding XRE family transcriptional regulator